MAEKRWISETLFDDLGFRMTYEVQRVLYEMQTEHQHLVLFEHKFFGKMLMLDGATQITKGDEFIYQEMMSHVPILAHGKARDVLIIGGGDALTRRATSSGPIRIPPRTTSNSWASAFVNASSEARNSVSWLRARRRGSPIAGSLRAAATSRTFAGRCRAACSIEAIAP